LLMLGRLPAVGARSLPIVNITDQLQADSEHLPEIAVREPCQVLVGKPDETPLPHVLQLRNDRAAVECLNAGRDPHAPTNRDVPRRVLTPERREVAAHQRIHLTCPLSIILTERAILDRLLGCLVEQVIPDLARIALGLAWLAVARHGCLLSRRRASCALRS